MKTQLEPVRALLVEDSENDALLLVEALRRGGYAPEWARVETEAALRAALAGREWDVVFCDYSMPLLDAPNALRVLRESGDTLTAIVVSGKVGEEVAAEAMMLGANDFVLKDNLGRVVLAMERELRAAAVRRERQGASQALRQSEERYRVLFDKSPWPMWVFSPETLRCLAVNEIAIKEYGYTRAEYADMTVKDLFAPENLPALVEYFEGTTANADALRRIVWRHRKKDGSMIVVEIANQPITYHGQAARVVQAIDITERTNAEIALRDSEERFRQMAENSGDVFWLIDATKSRLIYISPAYERIWGRTRESLEAQQASFLDAIHPNDRERVAGAFTRNGQGKYDVVYRIVRPDGTWRWIHDRAYPVKNEAGEVYRLAGIATDITEVKHAEEQIREQAALLDHAQDAILVQDLEGRITYWNKSAEGVFGWTAQEALGRKAQELLYETPEAYHASLAAALTRGDWIGEVTKRTKAESDVLVEGRWTIVRDEAGHPKAVLVVDTDITERKKIEAHFFRAQRMESIGTLAGGIAHDLNNVLGPIIMAVDLLKSRIKDPQDRNLLELVEASGKRGVDMVKQVLFFARGIEGRRVAVCPIQLVKDLEGIIRDTFPKILSIEADAPEGTWNMPGDRTQLHQVLLNLCVNARDAMPRGGRLRLSARNWVADEQFAAMHPQAAPGSYVILEVADTGEGMPPEVMERIFDPFFTTKEIGKGTGLGLSTTHAIVKSHGGFITVDSAPGKGTTFQVHLPAESRPSEAQPETSVVELPRGNGETILIIDDEASIRSITGQTLEAFGYRVMTAGDGAEGIAMFARSGGEIAAVLTDMMMPVMDGVSTIRVLVRLNPEVKIIAVSGSSVRGVETEVAGTGVKHFLAKPYTAETLLGTLCKLLHPEE